MKNFTKAFAVVALCLPLLAGMSIGPNVSPQQAPDPSLTLYQDFAASTTLAEAARRGPVVAYSGGGGNLSYFDSSGTLQFAANDVAAFDHDPVTLKPLGLSIWEASTNPIRNNTMQGASAGTPGTAPTNWILVPNGTTQEIVGIGEENGIDFIDIKLSGTPFSDPRFDFEATTQIVAANTETWTHSVYLALVGGDSTNLTGMNLMIIEREADGTFIKQGVGSDFLAGLTSTLVRTELTHTLDGGASVGRVHPAITIDWDGSGAIDLTLRIGLPQMEKLAFATPVIKTSSAAVTRTAVLATMTGTNFSDWFNQSEGTFSLDITPQVATGSAVVLSVSDGTANERILILQSSAGIRTFLATAAGNNIDYNAGTMVAGASNKIAVGFIQNDTATYLNGGAAGTDTDHAMPTVDRLNIGSNQSNAATFNGHIARIKYWNIRKPNVVLQIRTAFIDEGSPIYASNDNFAWGIAA